MFGSALLDRAPPPPAPAAAAALLASLRVSLQPRCWRVSESAAARASRALSAPRRQPGRDPRVARAAKGWRAASRTRTASSRCEHLPACENRSDSDGGPGLTRIRVAVLGFAPPSRPSVPAGGLQALRLPARTSEAAALRPQNGLAATETPGRQGGPVASARSACQGDILARVAKWRQWSGAQQLRIP